MSSSFFLISVILLVIIFFSDINHAVEEYKIEFDYVGKLGPAFWNTLSESSAICETGKKQSPIDITSEDLKTFAEAPQPKFNDAKNVEVLNNGNTVEISSGEEGTPLPAEITIDGEKYELQQFHFHTPSEHRIDGQHRDIEQHLVFQSETGKISVVAVLYNAGPKDSKFMAPIIENLPKKKDDVKKIKKVKLTNLLEDIKNVTESFTYSGSLTTPPCTEGVTWYVNQEAQDISFNQFSDLREITGFNARFTQVRADDQPAEPPADGEQPPAAEPPADGEQPPAAEPPADGEQPPPPPPEQPPVAEPPAGGEQPPAGQPPAAEPPAGGEQPPAGQPPAAEPPAGGEQPPAEPPAAEPPTTKKKRSLYSHSHFSKF